MKTALDSAIAFFPARSDLAVQAKAELRALRRASDTAAKVERCACKLTLACSCRAAIRFRQTITIRRPVGLEFLRKAYLRREIAWTNMITAQEIPWPLALDIIEKGLGIDE